MTNVLFVMDAKKSKATKKRKRLTYVEKWQLVLARIEKNVDFHEALHGHRGFGFRMSQIADMIGYVPSTALMVDLHIMADDGHLIAVQKPLRACGLSNYEYVFYTKRSYNHALKQGVLF